MPDRLQPWQHREIHYDLLPALVASANPASDADAARIKSELLFAGYDYMVRRYEVLNRQKRKEHAR